MTRLLAPLLVLGIVSGCTSSGSGNRPTDPFFGRTRIEPPNTGWAQGQRSPDPYYSQPSPGRYGASGTSVNTPAGTIGPPSVTLPPASSLQSPAGTQPPGNWQAPSGLPTPATTNPATGSKGPTVNLNAPGGSSSNIVPPAGVTIHGAGDRIEIPLASRQDAESPLAVTSRSENPGWLRPTSDAGQSSASAPAAASSAAASAASLATANPRYGNNAASSSLAGRERIVRVLEPRPATSASRASPISTSPNPSSLPTTASTRQSVDIMDLPPVGSSGLYRGSQSSGSAGQVQFVSATEPAGDSSSVTPGGRGSPATSATAVQTDDSSSVKRLDNR